jgi:5-deoxy-glucuronate isomerase
MPVGAAKDIQLINRGTHDMAVLLRKPFGTHVKVHDIAQQSAGWRYVGFGLLRLRACDHVAEATGDHEVILVIV